MRPVWYVGGGVRSPQVDLQWQGAYLMSKRRERRRAEALKQASRLRKLHERAGCPLGIWYSHYSPNGEPIYEDKINHRAKNRCPFSIRKEMILDGYRDDVPYVREKRADLSDGDLTE